MTVPVEGVPPTTLVGEIDNPRTMIGLIVSGAVNVVALRVAEIVAVAADETDVVVIVKVAEVCPESTVTDAGTVALALFEAKVITQPLGPAGLLMVTVPVEDVPPDTVLGATVKAIKPVGLMVSTEE